MIEEWRAVADYPDYEVSSYGRVRRVTACRVAPSGYLLKTDSCRAGNPYPRINLWRDGRSRLFMLHQLVCATFHGPKPTPDHEVAHWDGNESNLRADNLRWATRKENASDRTRHGNTLRGEAANGAKLNARLVTKIRGAHLKWGVPMCELARMYRVSPRTIHNVVNRLHYTNV